MKRNIVLLSLAIFSIFLGSQITEGCLLVPYWKSLSTTEFYTYFSKFGPIVGKFYTVLTIIAALIPISISVYCFRKKSTALKHSLLSTLFTVLFIAFFYIYFKGANLQFYNTAYNTEQLKAELITWEYLHWCRVLLEFLALIFLLKTVNIIINKKVQ